MSPAVEIIPAWVRVWRDGVAPLVSTAGLLALAKALALDDPRLIQGATTTPPPLQCVSDWPVEAACGLAYMGWQGDGLTTVAEVEEYFALLCFEIDRRINEPAGCRHFLNSFDDEPRMTFFPALLAEVRRSLAERDPTEDAPDEAKVGRRTP